MARVLTRVQEQLLIDGQRGYNHLGSDTTHWIYKGAEDLASAGLIIISDAQRGGLRFANTDAGNKFAEALQRF